MIDGWTKSPETRLIFVQIIRFQGTKKPYIKYCFKHLQNLKWQLLFFMSANQWGFAFFQTGISVVLFHVLWNKEFCPYFIHYLLNCLKSFIRHMIEVLVTNSILSRACTFFMCNYNFLFFYREVFLSHRTHNTWSMLADQLTLIWIILNSLGKLLLLLIREIENLKHSLFHGLHTSFRYCVKLRKFFTTSLNSLYYFP